MPDASLARGGSGGLRAGARQQLDHTSCWDFALGTVPKFSFCKDMASFPVPGVCLGFLSFLRVS